MNQNKSVSKKPSQLLPFIKSTNDRSSELEFFRKLDNCTDAITTLTNEIKFKQFFDGFFGKMGDLLSMYFDKKVHKDGKSPVLHRYNPKTENIVELNRNNFFQKRQKGMREKINLERQRDKEREFGDYIEQVHKKIYKGINNEHDHLQKIDSLRQSGNQLESSSQKGHSNIFRNSGILNEQLQELNNNDQENKQSQADQFYQAQQKQQLVNQKIRKIRKKQQSKKESQQDIKNTIPQSKQFSVLNKNMQRVINILEQIQIKCFNNKEKQLKEIQNIEGQQKEIMQSKEKQQKEIQSKERHKKETQSKEVWNEIHMLQAENKTLLQKIQMFEKKQLITPSSVLCDYKDNFIIVQMMDFDGIISKARKEFQNKNTTNLNNLFKNQLTEKKQEQIKQDMRRLFQSEFKAWTTNLFDKITQSSYFGFINKSLDKMSTKNYFSRNCIYNFIKVKEELEKRNQFGSQYVKTLMSMFNAELKESLRFLKTRYPQKDKIFYGKQISNLIPIMNLKFYQKCELAKVLNFKNRDEEFGWRHIKLFINRLIEETNTKYQLFEKNLKGLFKDENDGSLSQKSEFKYQIGSKIRINTPKYTEEEISQDGMQIKSGEIMRIIIKWIDSLEDSIKELLSSKTNKYQNSYLSQHQKVFNEILTNAKQLKQNNIKGSDNLSKLMVTVGQQLISGYQEYFKNVKQEEYKTNIFTSITALGLEGIVSNYLYELLKNYFKSVVRNLSVFHIFDLFRGKCSGSQKQIKQVYQNIKKSSIFEIVQVKNRINSANRDYLINLKMKGTILICQLQLCLNAGSRQDQLREYRASCQNVFNHFLYELERSKFGPLAEMVSVYSLNSDLPGHFNVPKLCDIKKDEKVFNHEVRVSGNFELQIVSSNANIQYICCSVQDMKTCDYCLKISTSYSQKYWVSVHDNVCQACLMKKLSFQTRGLIVLKNHYSKFLHVDSDEISAKFEDKNSFHFCITYDKLSNKVCKYMEMREANEVNCYYELVSKTKISKNDFYSFHLGQNLDVFELKTSYYKTECSIITHQSPLLREMTDEDLKMVEKEFKHNRQQALKIYYLPIQQNSKIGQKIYILCLFPNNQTKENDLLLKLNQKQSRQCRLYGKYDYQLFQHVPFKLENNLLSIVICKRLYNFPKLDTSSLQKLQFSVQCDLDKLEFSNLKLRNIMILRIDFFKSSDISKQQVLDIHNLNSEKIVQLDLKFYRFDDLHIKYIHTQVKSDNKQQILFSNPLPQLNKMKIYIDNFEYNSQKQTHIIVSVISKIEILSINSQCDTIIDLTGSVFQQLRTLQINDKLCLRQYQNIYTQLRGFDVNKGIQLSEIEQVYLNKVNISSIENLPVDKVAQFIASNCNTLQADETKIKCLTGDFSKLQQLKMPNLYCSCSKFNTLNNLEKLHIEGISKRSNTSQNQIARTEESDVVKKLHGFGLCNLKVLILQNKRLSKNEQTFRVQIDQQMNKLERLQIDGYDQVIITSQLRNLKRLRIKSKNIKQISTNCILSTQLQSLIFQKCDSLESVKLTPLQIACIKVVQFRDMDHLPRLVGAKMSNNYFRKLRHILFGRYQYPRQDFESWMKTSTQKTPIFNESGMVVYSEYQLMKQLLVKWLCSLS